MPLRRSPAAACAATLTVLVLAAAGCSGNGNGNGSGSADARAANPYAGHLSYADPGSKTAQAASTATNEGRGDQARVFTRLAETPQGVLVTPEEHPPGAVETYVESVVEAADRAGRVPTLVVYGVPDRDCSGGHSAGGLSQEQYVPWVDEIAAGVKDGGSAVPVAAVVEPDALASLVECGDRPQRVKLISDAVHALVGAGVTTYVDGGHSHWIDPSTMADLLREAGVADARGFATNVSNFQTDADEQAYGEKLSGLLGDAHYVIDSGRNGFGASGDWCNPPGRAFGTEPAAATDIGHLDAYLWVKPPGESDGTCNGGPPAGQFWPERALQLASASGW